MPSGRNLFGELSSPQLFNTFVGDINMQPTLDKLSTKLEQTNQISSSLLKPKALSGVDSNKRDEEFNNDLSIIQEASKESNLNEAYKKVVSKASEFSNKLKAGSYGALEQSTKEFEDRAKKYNELTQNGKVNADEAELRLSIDKAKHDLQGGTTANKLGGFETFARKNKDDLQQSTSAIDFAKQLELHDVGYKNGNYIDPNNSKLDPSVRGTFDQMYKDVSSQGVTPQRAYNYSKTIFENSPKIDKAVKQRAVTDVAIQLKNQGYSEEEIAQLIANDELNGNNTPIHDLIANKYQQYKNEYLSAGTQALYKSLGGVDYKGSFDPSYLAALKGSQIEGVNAPIAPTAATSNPQAVDVLANVNINDDGKIYTQQLYKVVNGKQIPLTEEESKNAINTNGVGSTSYGAAKIGNTGEYITKTKVELKPLDLYATNKDVQDIVNSSAQVDKIEGNVPNDWQFGNKYIAGTIKNYKEAVKNYKNVFIDERLNSAKKQTYKTKIDQATLSGRTFIPLSTENKNEVTGINIEQLTDKYGEIEKVTSSGSSTANPYNLFPLSDNLEIKFKDKSAPIKFITNLPDEKAQEAAKPLQNFMNLVYSAKPGEAELPVFGKVKLLVSYKDKQPKFLVEYKTKDGVKYTTPNELEKVYHQQFIFPLLKQTELSYFGSEDKTDFKSTEETE